MLNIGTHPCRAGALRVAGAIAGLALVLAGCGGNGDDTDSMDAAAAVVEDDSGDADSMEDDEAAGAEDAESMKDEDDASDEDDSTDDEDAESMEDDAADDASELAAGVYRAYSEDALAEAGYDTNVIFFHASWCPECRAFEQAIESEVIPDGVQILKADYDTEEDLKQRYEVQIQTTFVKVGADGEEISSWVGYEKDRSVDTILRELG